MTTPVRLQLSRKKGFDLQSLSLRTNGLPARAVTRASRWGNPFKVGEWIVTERCAHLQNTERLALPKIPVAGPLALDAAMACALFDQWIAAMYRCDRDAVKNWLAPLQGANLACFCHERETCHAGILLGWLPILNNKSLRPCS